MWTRETRLGRKSGQFNVTLKHLWKHPDWNILIVDYLQHLCILPGSLPLMAERTVHVRYVYLIAWRHRYPQGINNEETSSSNADHSSWTFSPTQLQKHVYILWPKFRHSDSGHLHMMTWRQWAEQLQKLSRAVHHSLSNIIYKNTLKWENPIISVCLMDSSANGLEGEP